MYKRKKERPNESGVSERYARDYLAVLLGFNGPSKGFYITDLRLYEAAIKKLELGKGE